MRIMALASGSVLNDHGASLPRQVTASAAVSTDRAAAPAKQAHGRLFNFSAGPACLPTVVLEQAQADLLNWQGAGGDLGVLGPSASAATMTISWAAAPSHTGHR